MLIWGEDKWRMYKDCLYYHYSIVPLYISLYIYIISLYILLLFANSYVNLRISQNKTDASGSCTVLMLKDSGPHKTPKCLRSDTFLSYHLLPNTIAVTITHHQEMAMYHLNYSAVFTSKTLSKLHSDKEKDENSAKDLSMAKLQFVASGPITQHFASFQHRTSYWHTQRTHSECASILIHLQRGFRFPPLLLETAWFNTSCYLRDKLSLNLQPSMTEKIKSSQ